MTPRPPLIIQGSSVAGRVARIVAAEAHLAAVLQARSRLAAICLAEQPALRTFRRAMRRLRQRAKRDGLTWAACDLRAVYIHGPANQALYVKWASELPSHGDNGPQGRFLLARAVGALTKLEKALVLTAPLRAALRQERVTRGEEAVERHVGVGMVAAFREGMAAHDRAEAKAEL